MDDLNDRYIIDRATKKASGNFAGEAQCEGIGRDVGTHHRELS